MTASMPGAEEYMQGPVWSPDNIAPVVCFLASDAAADVNGQVFVVWGTKFTSCRGGKRSTPSTGARDAGRPKS